MSFGKMNTKIRIISKKKVLDDEGFSHMEETTVAEVRAYREGRHGSKKWANMAQFSDATELFQIRVIPGVEITKDMRIICEERTFEIKSTENVKGRKMYLEVMAREITASG